MPNATTMSSHGSPIEVPSNPTNAANDTKILTRVLVASASSTSLPSSRPRLLSYQTMKMLMGRVSKIKATDMGVTVGGVPPVSRSKTSCSTSHPASSIKPPMPSVAIVSYLRWP